MRSCCEFKPKEKKPNFHGLFKFMKIFIKAGKLLVYRDSYKNTNEI